MHLKHITVAVLDDKSITILAPTNLSTPSTPPRICSSPAYITHAVTTTTNLQLSLSYITHAVTTTTNLQLSLIHYPRRHHHYESAAPLVHITQPSTHHDESCSSLVHIAHARHHYDESAALVQPFTHSVTTPRLLKLSVHITHAVTTTTNLQLSLSYITHAVTTTTTNLQLSGVHHNGLIQHRTKHLVENGTQKLVNYDPSAVFPFRKWNAELMQDSRHAICSRT
ncbi:hypothetical protein HNY73_004578 [Argiope bruennichi]|uniref:Uncharacterized protein n=1 Tax=Argiope bruennichi TaxID=94029 RepID=A0A8T0FTP9_ARGBR|nr:hypothetical protein HNY73_004578 [Argiope bruennichi]